MPKFTSQETINFINKMQEDGNCYHPHRCDCDIKCKLKATIKGMECDCGKVKEWA